MYIFKRADQWDFTHYLFLSSVTLIDSHASFILCLNITLSRIFDLFFSLKKTAYS